MHVFSLSHALWKFRDASTKTWMPATIPGCVHTDLQAAGKIPDPFHGTNELSLQWIEKRDWEYRTHFTLPTGIFAGEIIELVADGLDTVASVTLNGKVVARTDNMFVGYRWPVKHLLHAGRNELTILFRSAMDYIRTTRSQFSPPREFNDPVGNCVRIRKQQCQFGWDWGPRFVTAGIWRDIRLEAWSSNRLTCLDIKQHHAANGSVSLALAPEFARTGDSAICSAILTLAGREVARTDFTVGGDEAPTLAIPAPKLWWPAGQGDQPLYELVFTACDRTGRELGTIRKKLGLRTIKLDCSPDQWGESFRFLINRRPVFLKGANWIPAHGFVAGLTRRDYERDLRAAVAAHMNTMRVWGGGIYESEDFYDLCDELGLLVWQDFMFACTLYPADRAFLTSVRAEVAFQADRLRHRACLALWCGNNELAMLNPALQQPKFRTEYEKLFREVIPNALALHDAVTPYWPTSPWRGSIEAKSHEAGEKSGDSHYWDVWHARHPVKDYEKWAFRFVSEFGMQSYSSPETNATFCPPGQSNILGATMENHQKNRAGNQIVLDYVSRRYRYPNSQAGLIYLSQLNQAYCMQVGVEHYRRLMPRCMGALYWQLNDCWPVASWSSIEFTGRWKALHHAARRFFAPALVCAHLPGDEKPKIGNYRESTIDTAHLHTVYDAPSAANGALHWELRHLDGRRLLTGTRNVKLIPGTSVKHRTLDLRRHAAKHGRDQIYVRIWLEIGHQTVSEQTLFLSPPRFIELPRGRARVIARTISSTEIELRLNSPVFLHAFELNLTGLSHQISDNYFDLYPGVVKTVRVILDKKIKPMALLSRLQMRSLVDVCD
jgi:beta-mannosidase